ncbi:type II toxin-antitoxin system HipA family toxin [Aureimonas sp. AU22]|uniref:type II toxin-antitoxin system HipA family toxin n=1 Tax=Aureimonas sp. AU22 TaxID=1638162 RepID=UPI00178CBA37|nr:HipA domain-containing protein [Aureimonas sp. AU22]
MDAATIVFDEPRRGFEGSAHLSYEMDYVVETTASEMAQGIAVTDRRALSVNFPVDFADYQLRRWPAFLLDLMPQGHARRALLRDLNLDEHSRSSDLPLLVRAGGSTIGNIRIKEAWEEERRRLDGFDPIGVELEEILGRTDRFMEVVNRHAMLASGSSGLQGEWPKVAMTLSSDGLFYPDPFVTDDEAVEHVIVKLQREPNEEDAAILEAEVAYSHIAHDLGLNVHRPSTYAPGVAVIPRFDRTTMNGRVERHGQESMVSALGVSEFGWTDTHENYLRRLVEVSTSPRDDVVEYVLRDVANLAMGNSDNHGRNTAITKKADGTVRLSPLFDFAPMKLSRQTIMRSTKWECMRASGGEYSPDWEIVCDALAPLGVDPEDLMGEIRAFAERLADVPRWVGDYGLPDMVQRRALANCEEIVAGILGPEEAAPEKPVHVGPRP